MYLTFIFTAVFITGIATIYLFIIIPSRVSQYKKLAEELNAEYTPLKESNAKISGSINGRKYIIQTLLLGGGNPSGTGKAYYRYTELSVNCVNNGIPLLINRSFFKNFPNWKEIFTKGEKKERVFITYINIKNTRIPVDSKYRPQISSIFQEASKVYNNCINKGDIAIDALSVSLRTFGVMTNLEKIKRILIFLCSIAQNIENTPVSD